MEKDSWPRQLEATKRFLAKNGQESKLDSNEALLELFDRKASRDSSVLIGQPMMGPVQPQVAPLTVQTVQKMESAESTMGRLDDKIPVIKSYKEDKQQVLGQNVLEDPIGQLAFNKAMYDQNRSSVNSGPRSKDADPQVVFDQKERMIQSYMGSKKQPEANADSPELAMGKVTINETRFDNEEADTIDGPKRQTHRSEEFDVVSDTSAPMLQNNVVTVNSKVTGLEKVSHHTVPELFQKVESMVHHGGGKLTVTLTPPDLGQVEIHVSTKGKNVEVSVKSDNDFAKAAIESQVADLQQSLQNQDLNLSKIEVHVSREMEPSFLENQYAQFSGNGSLYQQSQSSRQDSAKNPWQVNHLDSSHPRNRMTTTSAVSTAALHGVNQGTGRVDIRI
ncbi:MAG: flagellar hook-length control protein FliK [Proteobacteria bacterium]|nr:flagellar hook-length control protein FliK [Pseudomonadota bacterium]